MTGQNNAYRTRRSLAYRCGRCVRICALVFVLTAICVPLAAAPQWRVRAVEFDGNNNYSDRALKSLMELRPKWPSYKTRYSEFLLRSDIEALHAFYVGNGYTHAKIVVDRVLRDTVKGHVRIFISVSEGPRTHVKTVGISAKKFELNSADRKKLTTKNGRPLIHANVRQDARLIKEMLGNQGFLEAVVVPEISLDTLENCSDVVFMVKEGPLVTVGDISVDGHKGVADKVVIRELAFKPGDTLDLKSVRNTERRLYTTGLFNFAQVRARLGADREQFDILDGAAESGRRRDSVDRDSAGGVDAGRRERVDYPDGVYDVRVRLTPSDFFRLQVGAGYSTDEGARLSLLSSYRNLFRQGHVITFDGKLSQISQRAEGIYLIPWIFYLPLYLESKVYYQRYDNAELYQGVFDGVRFAVGRQTDINVAYQFWTQWENVYWVRAPVEDAGPDGVPEIPTQSIGGDLIIDTRDDVFNPATGSYNRLSLEVAGVFGGNSNRFVKATFDTRWYFNYKMRNYWASALRVGWVRPYGISEVVPVQSRFYGGGGNTVRGFDVNKLAVLPNGDPLKGDFYVFANIIDFRFPVPIRALFHWVSTAVFIDAGNVWTNIEEIGAPKNFIKDVRWSAGPGIRVDTPIRLVARLDVGFKLDKRSGESSRVWHFDLGQPF